jgi:hypothetical protein
MTTVAGTQSDLFAWARDLEWENTRVAEIDGDQLCDLGRYSLHRMFPRLKAYHLASSHDMSTPNV